MKNLFLGLSIAFIAMSCTSTTTDETTTENADYVLIKGKITNHDGEILDILTQDKSFHKEISLSEDGSFSDTLFIEDSIYNYFLSHGGQYSNLFLKKGYDLEVTLDYNDFDNSIAYKGKGSDENNLMANILKFEIEANIYEMLESDDEAAYNTALENYTSGVEAMLTENKVDADLISNQKEILASKMEELAFYRNMILEEKALFAKLENQPTPEFTNFETPDGSSKSLKDFFGKYIYIDVWATWCGPCKAEVPYLKEVYKDYQDKMTFLSISVDDQKSKAKWAEMVKSEELVWNNVIADDAFNSEFIQAYGINSIPRFILIAPDGKVVRAGAPRPSSDDLRPLLDSLLGN